jgi:hypothetical protein
MASSSEFDDFVNYVPLFHELLLRQKHKTGFARRMSKVDLGPEVVPNPSSDLQGDFFLTPHFFQIKGVFVQESGLRLFRRGISFKNHPVYTQGHSSTPTTSSLVLFFNRRIPKILSFSDIL